MSRQIYVSYILCTTHKVKQMRFFYKCRNNINESTIRMCIANCLLSLIFSASKLTKWITLRELSEFHNDIISSEGILFNVFDPESTKDNRSLSAATLSTEEKVIYYIYMLSQMVKSVFDIFHKTVQARIKICSSQLFNCGFVEHFLLY